MVVLFVFRVIIMVVLCLIWWVVVGVFGVFISGVLVRF